jgi:hypothetical protein
MGDLPDNTKYNWSELFGLDTDQRMVEVQDIAVRRAYVVLVIQMVLLGGFLLFWRGQTGAAFSFGAVALSGLYLLWQRHHLGNGERLDERTQRTFNHQFHYMNIALYLVCLFLPLFGGSNLWVMLFFLPVIVIIGTLFFHHVHSWRLWLLWLAVSLLVGIALGLWIVLSVSTSRFSWIIIVCLAIFSAWLGIATYRRKRSM